MQSADHQHITVLLHEAVEGLAIKENGIYIDGTFGRGGHSRLILSKLGEQGRLIATDRDPRAIAQANTIEDARFEIHHTAFSAIPEVCQSLGLMGKIDGILLDLGVSSPQLDDASIEDLTWVLKEFGEERFAKRIATAIVNFNRTSGQKITRTLQLAQIISDAVPFKDKHKHPATRSFQAIRIFINSELEELAQALQSAIEVLAPQGRLSIISFHSLEDRMVKQFIKKNSKGKEVPRGLPILESELNKDIPLKAIGKAIMPSEEEIRENPRSRSAVLRVAEKR